jgi:ubiquinone/menaquinone biosynthesis C-methylase UbiE
MRAFAVFFVVAARFFTPAFTVPEPSTGAQPQFLAPQPAFLQSAPAWVASRETEGEGMGVTGQALLLGAVIGTVAALAVSAGTRVSEQVQTPPPFQNKVSVEQISEEDTRPRPGLTEESRYACSPSVQYWKTYSNDEAVRRVQALLQKYPTTAPPYFTAQLVKTMGLSVNGLAGLAAGALLKNSQGLDGGDSTDPGWLGATLASFPVMVQGIVGEVLGCAADDFEAIQAGKWKAPWNMPPQLPPQEIARSAWGSPVIGAIEGARFIRESVGVLDRRQRSDTEEVNTKNWLTSPLFPSYYSDSFHFQTDGWMSASSAEVYDTSTETLFGGRQDLMQRTALLPLASWPRRNERGLRILEVGCGSGKFSTFVRDNYESAQITLSDLSPFYLAQARAKHTKYARAKGIPDEGIMFVQADAGNLPFDSESFDVVINMYTFHELPAEARAQVASEMNRVAAKDALVILTDSAQLGDRPSMDSGLGRFGKLNEPFYTNYITTDLGLWFEEHGLKPYEKHVSSVTKTLSWLKAGDEAKEGTSAKTIEPVVDSAAVAAAELVEE